MISVIISTKNRHKDLLRCVKSILKNKNCDFEIIITDASDNDKTKNVINRIKNKKVKYYHSVNEGKTKMINCALIKAKGNIVCFTDDDNLVDNNWINNINKTYIENPDVHGVFGKTLPYRKLKNKGLKVANSFESNKFKIITDPYLVYYREIGTGNNMSFRKDTFARIGKFKTWLGPGNGDINGGEDGEFVFRVLKHDLKIVYDPKIIVYHNRWVAYDQWRTLQKTYTGGESAFYFYHFAKSRDFKMLLHYFRTFNERFFTKSLYKALLYFIKHFGTKGKRNLFYELRYSFKELVAVINGAKTALNQIYDR